MKPCTSAPYLLFTDGSNVLCFCSVLLPKVIRGKILATGLKQKLETLAPICHLLDLIHLSLP